MPLPNDLPIVLLGLAALLLFGFGHLLARAGIGLTQAEMTACRNSEKMPLAAIAGMARDPTGWFARNLASMIGAWKNDETGLRSRQG